MTPEELTKCGVFKLNDKSRPIGIMKLNSKILSSRLNNYHPFKSHILHNLIYELSDSLQNYHKEFASPSFEEKIYDNFEEYLVESLAGWGIVPDDLRSEFDKFVRKTRKLLEKRFANPGSVNQRDEVIFQMHRTFKKHTNFNTNSILIYISFLLIFCGIEDGTPGKVFKKIERQFHRKRDDFNSRMAGFSWHTINK